MDRGEEINVQIIGALKNSYRFIEQSF
ncbi:protein of unknown function [Agreia sp. COWG]|nr:protein of unknown function [Agreia sp. COWG]